MHKETIPLEHPVAHGGVSYKELSMRRPKVRDQLVSQKLAGSESEEEVILFANLCEIPREVVEDMDLKDYGRLQDVYKGFLS